MLPRFWIPQTTAYLWVNQVFKGAGDEPHETSCQPEMKKRKPTATHSEKAAIATPVVVQEATAPITYEQCRQALKNNGEPIEADEKAKEETIEEIDEEASLLDLDEKALRKMVGKLRKQVKTQTVWGDLYKKMLEIASDDTGIDFLKKHGVGQ